MSVRLVMALSIFLSYAIQFYVPATTAWPICAPFLSCGRKNNDAAEYAFRAALVILTCKFSILEWIVQCIGNVIIMGWVCKLFSVAVAISVPNLGLFISLVGAFCSSVLGLIMPPIFGICCNWAEGYGMFRWKLLKDLFLIFIGLVCCCTATYVSMREIVASV